MNKYEYRAMKRQNANTGSSLVDLMIFLFFLCMIVGALGGH